MLLRNAPGGSQAIDERNAPPVAADLGIDGYTRLFEAHVDEIRTFLFRRSADWTTADDLTSIVFLEAWRRKDANVPDEARRAWLYGVATNVLRNERRSRRRHQAALGRMSAERHQPDFRDDADERLDDERRMRALLPHVAALRRSEQEALALCAWSGLTYEEAAIALGVPVGTVRSRLARAKARLRELSPVERTSSEQPHRLEESE